MNLKEISKIKMLWVTPVLNFNILIKWTHSKIIIEIVEVYSGGDKYT